MTGLVILIAAFCAVAAVVIWADVKGFDPFTRLYGTDPRELVDRARDRGER